MAAHAWAANWTTSRADSSSRPINRLEGDCQWPAATGSQVQSDRRTGSWRWPAGDCPPNPHQPANGSLRLANHTAASPGAYTSLLQLFTTPSWPSPPAAATRFTQSPHPCIMAPRSSAGGARCSPISPFDASGFPSAQVFDAMLWPLSKRALSSVDKLFESLVDSPAVGSVWKRP